MSSGQIMPSSSLSKNATCLCNDVFFFPTSKPVSGAERAPFSGATIIINEKSGWVVVKKKKVDFELGENRL